MSMLLLYFFDVRIATPCRINIYNPPYSRTLSKKLEQVNFEVVGKHGTIRKKVLFVLVTMPCTERQKPYERFQLKQLHPTLS